MASCMADVSCMDYMTSVGMAKVDMWHHGRLTCGKMKLGIRGKG